MSSFRRSNKHSSIPRQLSFRTIDKDLFDFFVSSTAAASRSWNPRSYSSSGNNTPRVERAYSAVNEATNEHQEDCGSSPSQSSSQDAITFSRSSQPQNLPVSLHAHSKSQEYSSDSDTTSTTDSSRFASLDSTNKDIKDIYSNDTPLPQGTKIILHDHFTDLLDRRLADLKADQRRLFYLAYGESDDEDGAEGQTPTAEDYGYAQVDQSQFSTGDSYTQSFRVIQSEYIVTESPQKPRQYALSSMRHSQDEDATPRRNNRPGLCTAAQHVNHIAHTDLKRSSDNDDRDTSVKRVKYSRSPKHSQVSRVLSNISNSNGVIRRSYSTFPDHLVDADLGRKSRTSSQLQLPNITPASVRRAASLQSEYHYSQEEDYYDYDEYSNSSDDESVHTTADNAHINKPKSIIRTISQRFDLIPTEPTTPSQEYGFQTHLLLISRIKPPLRISYPVPIIAPPPNHLPRLFSLSEENLAKIRIQRFLDRDNSRTDRLGVSSSYTATWDVALGLAPSFRRQVLKWILDVIPGQTAYEEPISNFSSQSNSPSPSMFHLPGFNLHDQLTSSPETRFHAAYIFELYFSVLCQDGTMDDTRLSTGMADLLTNGKVWIVWDIALASLALSVKLHRDVLRPLFCIGAEEFHALAPHSLTLGDLEAAQRNILSAFSYSLGDTPQALLDELWLALPSLRALLDFNSGWDNAQKETWWNLFDALMEPDVLGYSIAVLTSAALVEGLVASLMRKYEQESTLDWRLDATIRRRSRIDSNRSALGRPELRNKRLKRANLAIEGVVADMAALLNFSNNTLLGARNWLGQVGKGTPSPVKSSSSSSFGL